MSMCVEKFKIFKSVVSLVTIYMMNVFNGFKIPSKMLRHDKSMFWNFSSDVSHWMTWKIQFYISPLSHGSICGPTSVFLSPFTCAKTRITITKKSIFYNGFSNIANWTKSFFFTFTTTNFDKNSSPNMWLISTAFPFFQQSTFSTVPKNNRFAFLNHLDSRRIRFFLSCHFIIIYGIFIMTRHYTGGVYPFPI